MEKIYLPKDWVCNGSELKPKNGGSRETWIYNGKGLKLKLMQLAEKLGSLTAKN